MLVHSRRNWKDKKMISRIIRTNWENWLQRQRINLLNISNKMNTSKVTLLLYSYYQKVVIIGRQTKIRKPQKIEISVFGNKESRGAQKYTTVMWQNSSLSRNPQRRELIANERNPTWKRKTLRRERKMVQRGWYSEAYHWWAEGEDWGIESGDKRGRDQVCLCIGEDQKLRKLDFDAHLKTEIEKQASQTLQRIDKQTRPKSQLAIVYVRLSLGR